MLKFAQKLSKLPTETLPVQAEVVAVASKAPAPIIGATIPANDYAELFASHCKRDGWPLEPDGSCQLCNRPLPF